MSDVFRIDTMDTKYSVQFNEGDKEVGKIYIEDGKLYFDGNIDKSAEKFFGVMKQICDKYIDAQMTKVCKP